MSIFTDDMRRMLNEQWLGFIATVCPGAVYLHAEIVPPPRSVWSAILVSASLVRGDYRMPLKRGHPKYGGRRKGVPDRRNRVRRDVIQRAGAMLGHEQLRDITPLEGLLLCMHWAIAKDSSLLVSYGVAFVQLVEPIEEILAKSDFCGRRAPANGPNS